jgi:hypothetical protein
VSRVVNLFYSSLSLIVNTLACHVVYDLTPSPSKELLGVNIHESQDKLSSILSKASTGAYRPIRILLYNYIYFIITCASPYRSLLKP